MVESHKIEHSYLGKYWRTKGLLVLRRWPHWDAT